MNKLIKARNVLRVALYIRVSTQEQANEGYSVGEQTERLKKYAEAMQWDVYKIYVDPGYSGGNTDRPGLNEMVKDVKTGEIDKVVVYKLDRLSRSQLDTLYLIEKVFLANDTDFVSMNENFDTSTPFGRAMIGILAVFAQLEREQIKERMNMGKEARAKEGKWGGGSSEPIGYDYSVSDDMLYINAYEAMQIREAVDLFLKGTPLRTIENIFNQKGYLYKGRSGKMHKWDPQRLKYVFGSKTYLGYIKYHDQWYKGDHTPILDQETFDKLQILLRQRSDDYKQTGLKPGAQSTYLGGLLYCKCCGGRFSKQLNSRYKEGKPKVYWYMCYSRHKRVKKMIKDPNCKNKNWKMVELDNLVFNEIRKLALDPEYIHDLRQVRAKKTDTPNKIEIIQNKINELDDQISRFMDLYGIGKFTIDQVSGKIDPLNEQKVALEKELAELNASSGSLTEEETIKLVTSFEEVLARGDFNEIRLIIESLIYYIEIDNEDIYIHWKFA